LFTAFPSQSAKSRIDPSDNTPEIAAGHYWRGFRRVNAQTTESWGKPALAAGLADISQHGTDLCSQ
jgi:hypothetical protein